MLLKPEAAIANGVVHGLAVLPGLCRCRLGRSGLGDRLELLIDQRFELGPGQGSFHDRAPMFAVARGGADHKGGVGKDVVQPCSRHVGVNRGVGAGALHAGLQVCCVDAGARNDLHDAFALQACLLIKQGPVGLPVLVVSSQPRSQNC